MSIKPKQKIVFQTTGRSGRSAERRGKVVEVYSTARGAFVLIAGEDGKEYRARPALCRAA